MLKKTYFGSKFAAALAAGLLCVTLSVPTAQADSRVVTGATTNVVTKDPATIDTSKTIDLTLVRDPFTDKDGVAQPVSGVKFVMKKLDGYRVDSVEGWKKATSLSVEQAQKISGQEFTATTGEDGKANFSNLPVGVYLVTEKVTDAEGENHRETVPFVLILPLYNADKDEWAYRAVIRPKTYPNPKTKPKEPPTEVTPPPEGPSGSSVIPFIPIVFLPPLVKANPPATPVNPPETPVAPKQPATPVKPEQPLIEKVKNRLPLPNTGANVLIVYGLGLGILVLGLVLVFARKRRAPGEN